MKASNTGPVGGPDSDSFTRAVEEIAASVEQQAAQPARPRRLQKHVPAASGQDTRAVGVPDPVILDPAPAIVIQPAPRRATFASVLRTYGVGILTGAAVVVLATNWMYPRSIASAPAAASPAGSVAPAATSPPAAVDTARSETPVIASPPATSTVSREAPPVTSPPAVANVITRMPSLETLEPPIPAAQEVERPVARIPDPVPQLQADNEEPNYWRDNRTYEIVYRVGGGNLTRMSRALTVLRLRLPKIDSGLNMWSEQGPDRTVDIHLEIPYEQRVNMPLAEAQLGNWTAFGGGCGTTCEPVRRGAKEPESLHSVPTPHAPGAFLTNRFRVNDDPELALLLSQLDPRP
jgi:hypothetical protein